MKIGFDYWQVVSHYPDQIAHLIFGSQELGGDEIHIISAIGKGRVGTIRPDVENSFDDSSYIVEPEWYEVHEVVFDNPRQSPELKLAKCKELGITMFFDDREDVCRLLNANGIMALQVHRRDGSKYDLKSERSDTKVEGTDLLSERSTPASGDLEAQTGAGEKGRL